MRRRTLTRVAAVLLLTTAASACTSATGARDRRDGMRSPGTVAAPSVGPGAGRAARTVRSFVPVLRASVPRGVSDRAMRRLQRAPGVAAAARVALGEVEARGPNGFAGLSLAAVVPAEFRRIAPAPTAQESLVWSSLREGSVFLAHEEGGRLRAPLGASLILRGPEGVDALRLGGLAASGTPNLAGAMIDLRWARRLGIDRPTQVLIALDRGASPARVIPEIRRRLGVKPEPLHRRPDAFSYVSGDQVARMFGSFRYTPRSDGSIAIDPSWVRANIRTRRVPILGSVTCHRLIFPQLIGALSELQRAGLSRLVDARDYHYQGGCYNPRFIGRNPENPLSMHAWGLALDINVAANPAGTRPRQDPRLVAAFERWGFRWGGRWSRPDAMHFELAGLIRR